MENASKALLIAAAILVVILIITLGISVYRMAASSVGKVNLTEQEIAAFNGKFTVYCGKNKRASEVDALMETVVASNIANNDTMVTVMTHTGLKSDGTYSSKRSVIKSDYDAAWAATRSYGNPLEVPTRDQSKLSNSKVYNVTYEMDKNSGLIYFIDVWEQ